MSLDREDDEEGRGGLGRVARIAVPVLVFAALAGGVYTMLTSTSGMRREAPPLPTLQATLPPPPPPPKEKPPEEKKVVEEKRIETPEPKQPQDAPKPLTINGPAQAGNDAFNLASGTGGGDIASGFGNDNYGRYLTSMLQDAIQQDDRLNHLAFTVQVAATVDQNRKLHIRILKSSGDSDLDNDILSAAQQVALDEEPPGPTEFRLSIHSRRPA
ncbi:MAG TPA: hypothetical protein VG889_19185 [Rhizomicrobium sp.]|nr:hypothetical protein [Rhizomicrobium sp.]